MFRKTYALINESVLTENIQNIKQNYPDFDYYFGVVKGNAYGHGFHTVNALIKGGINYLAVATADEALAVRKQNADIPILCLEPVDSSFFEEASKQNITLTVDSLSCYRELCEKLSGKLKIHIKLDTGMNRLGIKTNAELKNILEEKNENITVEGIFTHFATSGSNDPYYDIQCDNLSQITKDIDLSQIPIVHTDRSLTLVRHGKKEFTNGVRLGICMYGFSQSMPEPSKLAKLKRKLLSGGKRFSECTYKNNLQLKTAFSLYSSVIAVKKVKAGEFIGYGALFTAKTDITVATIAIGYYDGMKNFGKVNIGGKNFAVLGELCMDMITVQADDTVKVGDTVEIFGDKISIKSAAAAANTNAYKVLTGISERVERIYK